MPATKSNIHLRVEGSISLECQGFEFRVAWSRRLKDADCCAPPFSTSITLKFVFQQREIRVNVSQVSRKVLVTFS
jgi:hypothetical protein